ncbi:MAG: dihydroorotate dehydrogenase electron transfer subunit [Lachnospiraceae bacterium]|nr:dihydroorotate dehydrogenase electron transfer subunit [Lachnospiraceae bacterium]
MAKEFKTLVYRNEEIAKDIFDLKLSVPEDFNSVAGQFVMIGVNDSSKLLKRPISICECKDGILRLVFRIAGEGTKKLSLLKAGDEVTVLGPVGNGYPFKEGEDRKVLLLGGGIGIPPILGAEKALKNSAKVTSILGYRDEMVFLNADFERESFLTSDSCGVSVEEYASLSALERKNVQIKGNAVSVAKALELANLLDFSEYDIICACGPMPMLRAVKQLAAEKGIKAYISLEERMACGIGACLGCVCKTVKKDAHTNVNNARVCKEGPVFLAEDVEI